MASMIKFLVAFAVFASAVVGLRLQRVLRYKRNRPIRHGRRNPNEPTHLMIVLGSGGHTAEMIAMLERSVTSPQAASRLDWRDYKHRTWVVSSGDSISAQRAKDFEELAGPLSSQDGFMAGKVRKSTDWGEGTYDIVTVPRAREIHQSLLTAPISSVHCAIACWHVLSKYATEKNINDGTKVNVYDTDGPDLILCNGPATATIVVLVSIAMRFVNHKGYGTRGRLRTIYIESWARVKSLSLSGQVLRNLVDRFVVQWPQLQQKLGGKTEYIGALA